MSEEKKKPENPKAFPGNNNDYKEPFDMPIMHEGMTLMDYFAAKAMQGELACQSEFFGEYENNETNLSLLAKKSYAIAKAMLKAREEEL